LVVFRLVVSRTVLAASRSVHTAWFCWVSFFLTLSLAVLIPLLHLLLLLFPWWA
jgi:hypothetical protein